MEKLNQAKLAEDTKKIEAAGRLEKERIDEEAERIRKETELKLS